MSDHGSLEYPIVCAGPGDEPHPLRVLGIVRVLSRGRVVFRVGDDLPGRPFETCEREGHVLVYCFACGRAAMPTGGQLGSVTMACLVRHAGRVELTFLRLVDARARLW